MNQTGHTEREHVLAGGSVEWDDHGRGVAKFSASEQSSFDPLTDSDIRELQETGEVISTPHGHDLDDLFEWVDRITADIENHEGATVGFGGFMTAPSHPSHPMTHIDSLVAVTTDESFSTKLQLEFVKEFRFADEITVEDDTLYFWID